MSAPSGKISVSVGQKCAFIKIEGRANFNSSVDFKILLDELLNKGYSLFVLDVTHCVLMDSTFLGVLAGFGLKINAAQADNVSRTIELFNPNARIAELLENLGVLHLFKVVNGEVVCPEKTEPADVTTTNASRETVTRTCLEAHQTLMDINPDNVSRFKDVAQFLAEDLKKMKSGD
ncbi:MAG: hypothetical protein QOD03_678 [Verrucomicrobiota bacterium]|jgi:anti-anti-sigma regulatory factor